jgi:hypothetical protein
MAVFGLVSAQHSQFTRAVQHISHTLHMWADNACQISLELVCMCVSNAPEHDHRQDIGHSIRFNERSEWPNETSKSLIILEPLTKWSTNEIKSVAKFEFCLINEQNFNSNLYSLPKSIMQFEHLSLVYMENFN